MAASSFTLMSSVSERFEKEDPAVTHQAMQATAPLAEPVVAKRMNLMQLTFIVAVNMMGSGIIMLPTNMAKIGAISLLSWMVTASARWR